MSGPIYLLFLGKPTEAWYQLSQEEQDGLMAKVGPVTERAGGKNIIGCNSSWSSEQWQFFGVHEFPNIEAVQKQYELLNELNWLRYVDSMTVLGTKWPET
jgi:hypothetical protein